MRDRWLRLVHERTTLACLCFVRLVKYVWSDSIYDKLGRRDGSPRRHLDTLSTSAPLHLCLWMAYNLCLLQECSEDRRRQGVFISMWALISYGSCSPLRSWYARNRVMSRKRTLMSVHLRWSLSLSLFETRTDGDNWDGFRWWIVSRPPRARA